MNTYLPLAVIRSLGISATHLGYYYLNTSILLILEDENRLLMVSKLLYPLVAEIHSTTPSCVERNIRTERLFQIAGCRLQSKPTNGEFIDILSCYIKKHNPSVEWKQNGTLLSMLVIPENHSRSSRPVSS